MDGSGSGVVQLSLELREQPLLMHAMQLLDKKVLVVEIEVGGRGFEVRVNLRQRLDERTAAMFASAIDLAVRARLKDAIKALATQHCELKRRES